MHPCRYTGYLCIFIYRSASPEDNESAQIVLYNSVRMEPDVTETADNPQYGDTMKQSDTTANPKSNENVYSYAVP